MAWGTLTLLAGPNGAGKSTLVGRLYSSGGLADHKLLNADDRTLAKARHAEFSGFAETPPNLLVKYFIESANEVFAEAMALLESGQDVTMEPVLSTGKYREMVTKALEGGGRFELIYVGLRNHQISKERVALRVQKGGHDVPEDRLEERWKRSLEQLKWFAPKATRFSVHDHSTHPSVMLADGHEGQITWHVEMSKVFPKMRSTLEEAFKDSP